VSKGNVYSCKITVGQRCVAFMCDSIFKEYGASSNFSAADELIALYTCRYSENVIILSDGFAKITRAKQ